MSEQVLTDGMKAVGADFNPSKFPEVDRVKHVYAALWDVIDELQKVAKNGAIAREYSLAKTHIEDSCYRAVKGLTYPY